MRWIYISPHLDDAVLSCGGLIQEQSISKTLVEIWTICAGDPPEGDLSPLALRLHEEWGSGSETPASRRAEDVAACQLLGVRHRHLSFLDCIYRQASDGTWLYPDEGSIQGPLSPQDDFTIRTLETFLVAILKPDDVVVCPLTIGKHVDHQMVRQAIEGLNRPFLYYADIPYLFNHPTQLPELTQFFKPQVYPFSNQALVFWLEAIRIYKSQIASLFNNTEQMYNNLVAYYQKEQGLCLWKSS